jgi:hypothetical protein
METPGKWMEIDGNGSKYLAGSQSKHLLLTTYHDSSAIERSSSQLVAFKMMKGKMPISKYN